MPAAPSARAAVVSDQLLAHILAFLADKALLIQFYEQSLTVTFTEHHLLKGQKLSRLSPLIT